jgi:hypothetical protein
MALKKEKKNKSKTDTKQEKNKNKTKRTRKGCTSKKKTRRQFETWLVYRRMQREEID